MRAGGIRRWIGIAARRLAWCARRRSPETRCSCGDTGRRFTSTRTCRRRRGFWIRSRSPADRHLTQSTPVETGQSRARRAELAASRPTFVVDGLGEYNPRLAVTEFDDLRAWMAGYREVGRSAESVIYRRE